ncbi:type IX secretion system periplasmic lipoprotein PorW/SprE [Flavobacterium silvisoli]|uniref:type IX secretion system periplasmic lipoprotein PorW/SprE n=1 Tax=Flavobacterium silvisoli TaxID=2529433 RepID=UPI001F025644|nr:tetratricopeptide repeat protein [Flavobacterium silvisoli]
MKTNTLKYFICSGMLVFLIACSTKKNTFLSRNSHALSTKYNILYNGGIALDKGIQDVVLQNRDNFWERLPVERMQVSDENRMPGDVKNPNFDRAETKATKAIQKHSMNIQGSEKNPQMDEAHLMLGKARYYDQRFVPALEAFNYVLYKYPNSDKIYEVKIWREKTNMRLENDALAVNNLRKLLKEIHFKDQIFADANATLAQAFLNLEEKDSAIAKIKIATEFTKSNEEKARYRFILAQLYEELGYKDSAYATYQSVIDMHRKSARQYVIHAHIRQSSQFDFAKGDTIAFLKKYNDLLEDRENRPYLDALNHQMGLFYDKQKNYTQAKKYYNISLKKKTQDTYLIASNYRNLADIYFNSAKYATAGKYYDSTLVQLKPRTREFNLIKKKRENLEDVIKYEGIAVRNDSIISVYNMSENDKKAYFEKYIEKLKDQEKAAQKLADKAAIIKENQERDGGMMSPDGKTNRMMPPSKGPDLAAAGSTFYFYNPATVAYGKKEFIRIWGKRTLKDNWRVASVADKDSDKEADKDKDTVEKNAENTDGVAPVDEKFTPDFYIKQLPTSTVVIDSLAKERNFAYYQLGVIYKEKFKENQLAVNKFEQLLKNKPEERLVLPSMYNLYKLYQLSDSSKAEAMKAQIIAQYPDSRYAQILLNPSGEIDKSNDSPSAVYESIYKQYQNGEYKTVLIATEKAIERYTGEEIVPKFELLKAQVIGKLGGLSEYSKALNFVALNYPNSEEGKRAEKLLSVDLPKLEALQLSSGDSKNWKILYKSKDFEDKNTKTLIEKINKFIKDRDLKRLTLSKDIYTMTDNFVVIHGITSKDLATGITSILKEFKEYKVPDTPIIISAENYTIVQIKKNLEDYLAGKLVDNPEQPNWDGTFERAPEPKQPKPQPKQQVTEDQPEGSDQIEEPKNFKNPKSPEGQGPTKAQQKAQGLPPAPQMEPNRKG